MLITLCEIGTKATDKKIFFDVDDEEYPSKQEIHDLMVQGFKGTETTRWQLHMKPPNKSRFVNEKIVI